MADQSSKPSSTNSKNNKSITDLSNLVFGKLQPQAVQLEEAILGALMLDKESLPIIMDLIKHRPIKMAMQFLL